MQAQGNLLMQTETQVFAMLRKLKNEKVRAPIHFGSKRH
jgi:hypothetical protein